MIPLLLRVPWQLCIALAMSFFVFVALWLTLPPVPKKTLVLPGNLTWPAVGSADGKTLGVGGESWTSVWRIGEERELARWQGVPGKPRPWPLAISADGSLVAIQEYPDRFIVWDASTGKERLVLEREFGASMGIDFSRDNRFLAMIDITRRSNGRPSAILHLWDLQTGEKRDLITSSSQLRCVTFSPDGRTLACGVYAGMGSQCAIKIWDVESGTERPALVGLALPYALAFSSDGSTMAALSVDRTLHVWDWPSGRKRLEVPNCTPLAVRSVQFSPEGNILATGEVSWYGSHPVYARLPGWVRQMLYSEPVALRDVRTGRRLATLPDSRLLTFSDDGKTLLTYSSNGTLKWWDVPPERSLGRMLAWASLAGFLTLFLLMSFAPLLSLTRELASSSMRAE